MTKELKLTIANPSEGHGVLPGWDEELAMGEAVGNALLGVTSTVSVTISNDIRGDADDGSIEGNGELVDAGLIISDLEDGVNVVVKGDASGLRVASGALDELKERKSTTNIALK